MVGASRRYDGPMGKSDRAFCLGLLATLWAFGIISALWLNAFLVVMLLLLLVTITNRVHRGVDESLSDNTDKTKHG